eukprot:10577798-Ditylum_brightwellii.AAC.2
MLEAEGRAARPVMCNSKGELLTSSWVEKEFHAQLARVQLSHPLIIDPVIDTAELYGISPSPSRGLLSQATNQGVNKESHNLQN